MVPAGSGGSRSGGLIAAGAGDVNAGIDWRHGTGSSKRSSSCV